MRVAVLGGGLQGASVALALAARGARVDLFEKRAGCMTQASRQNEGKIHFGYVFANDASLASSRLMIDGALVFEPLIRRWLGARADALTPSAPFHYFVHRDSLLQPDELQARYDAIAAYARDVGAGASCYGADPRAPVRRLAESERDVIADARTVQAAFITPEIALDPFVLSDLVVAALDAEPAITVHLNCMATKITPQARDCVVAIEGPGGPAELAYDHVVNATWEDLLALDVSAGAPLPAAPWSWRVKHFVRVANADVPTATIVLGPFGDIVRYRDSGAMLSWYPVGRRGMSSDVRPPAWPLELDDAAAEEARRGILEGLARIAPAVAGIPDASSAQVYGGIIYAAGDTDVDRRDSGLHVRSSVGPVSRGRYHTVNTGKWTLAPLFAERLARTLTDEP